MRVGKTYARVLLETNNVTAFVYMMEVEYFKDLRRSR